MYLKYSSKRILTESSSKPDWYQVRVWLESHRTEDLRRCTRVTYSLYHDFKPDVIATEARNRQFELCLDTSRQCMIVAFVEVANGDPVYLTQYLSFSGVDSGKSKR